MIWQLRMLRNDAEGNLLKNWGLSLNFVQGILRKCKGRIYSWPKRRPLIMERTEQERYSENTHTFYKDQALRAKADSFKKGGLFKQASMEKRFYLLVADSFTMMLSVILGY